MMLSKIPNAAPYVKIHETDRAVYLVRPFMASNLYDRIRQVRLTHSFI
jgi:hypothetical protein